jgi:AraC family ethanolamine operon transcriptional activator
MVEATVNDRDQQFFAGEPPPDAERFCSIEEMQATADAQGWSATYRQLQAGKLLASSYSGACGEITLADEFVSRQAEVVGATPDAHITVVVPITSASLWVNGHDFDRHGVLCLPSGAEMHAVARENHRGLKMHVPITLLQMAGLDTCDVWTRLIGGESVYVESDGAASTHLRRLIHVALYEPSRASEQSDRAGELISCLHSIITLSGESQSRETTGSSGEKHRVVKRSREYIEAHLFEPIHIGEVCRCAATSISKLERTFRHELQMSPSQYILKRRLIRVNKALKQNGSSNAHVTQVAMEYGFNHLGRFANAYSAHFGELPSETVIQN